MIAGLLAALLADLVFDAAAFMRRSFTTDMDRYLEQRGFTTAPKPTQTPGR